MKLRFEKRYIKHYAQLPLGVRVRADKQLVLLLQNPQHPSLRLKKMGGNKNRWEISVTMSYRITFSMVDDCYLLRDIGPHDILGKK